MNKNKLLVLSNITHEPFFSKNLRMNKAVDWNIQYHNIFEGEDYDLGEAEYVIVWINYERLLEQFHFSHFDKREISETIVDYCRIHLLKVLESNLSNIIYVSLENFFNKTYYVQGNIMDCVDNINYIDYRLCELFEAVHIIDIKKVIAHIGIDNAYNESNMLRWNSPYSELFYCEILKDINRIFYSQEKVYYKCLALDCDNVLWGGIVSEQIVSLGDIGEGRIYKDFQKFIYFLFRKGFILTILSKNDKEDVISMFRNDRDMILKEDYISYFGVSWNNKYEEIEKMADFLHIALDSIVFIDDSLFEIELMRKKCPSVKSIQFNPKTIYRELSFLNVSGKDLLEQNIIRTENFKVDAKREKLKSQTSSYADYLREIETEVSIADAQKVEYKRIAELSQRVNRVTNGKRYNIGEIIEEANQSDIYTVHVKDKYGDLGLVGAMVVKNEQLSLFCLSCRALGRSVEEQMIEFLQRKYVIESCVYKETGKNQKVYLLLKKLCENIQMS